MSALKEKQKQEKELLSSKANLMIADFLIDLDNLKTLGYISDYEFNTIKNNVFNCKVNIAGVSVSYIQKDLKNWIMFLKIGLINNSTFCNGINNILIYNIFDEKRFPALLSDDAPIKNQIINLSEIGCKITEKSFSRNNMTVIMKKGPYTITITRYKSFFWREWKKKTLLTDIDGNKYNYTSSEIYNIVAKL